MLDTSPPDISIVIPTLQGYDNLYALLQDIGQTLDYSYETIVIDSGNKPRGYGIPTNRGLRIAQGKILVVLNDDLRMEGEWLEPLVAEIENGAWCAFPDQREREGPTCLCGWCLAYSRECYDFLAFQPGQWDQFYDEQFILWCSDVDIAKRLNIAGKSPISVEIPGKITHISNATTSREDLYWTDRMGVMDLLRYEAKWGTEANKDKYELQPIYR